MLNAGGHINRPAVFSECPERSLHLEGLKGTTPSERVLLELTKPVQTRNGSPLSLVQLSGRR
jgi:hypothetical protein